jgi:hypothetical protein
MWVDAVYATFRQLNFLKFKRFSFPFDSLILQCVFAFGAERFQCPFVVYPADPSLLIGDFEYRRCDNVGDLPGSLIWPYKFSSDPF